MIVACPFERKAMPDLTLSFDNGPEPDATPGVLDTLARRSIGTTFFVVGSKLATAQGASLIERAHAEGHWIGNHTWTHSLPLGYRAPDAIEQEIGRTQQAIGPLAHPRKLFRPFGGGGRLDQGLLSPAAVDFLVRGRFTCVLWNAIPRDWDDPDGWVERALAQCAAASWTLMVLHDLPTGAMRHLDRFLDGVAERKIRLRQDFPPDCVPIADGKIVLPVDRYVMREGGS
jgi:peptidoglycan/xylan/chitin deacetylase (PgdA/CDA1 family)